MSSLNSINNGEAGEEYGQGMVWDLWRRYKKLLPRVKNKMPDRSPHESFVGREKKPGVRRLKTTLSNIRRMFG